MFPQSFHSKHSAKMSVSIKLEFAENILLMKILRKLLKMCIIFTAMHHRENDRCLNAHLQYFWFSVSHQTLTRSFI